LLRLVVSRLDSYLSIIRLVGKKKKKKRKLSLDVGAEDAEDEVMKVS